MYPRVLLTVVQLTKKQQPTKLPFCKILVFVLSHIPNTSLQCSNQPLWKLSLMTGVNMTKQQTREIKNTI